MTAFDPSSGAQPHNRVYANEVSEGRRLGKYMLFDRPANPFIYTVASTVPALPTAGAAQIDGIIVPGAFGNDFLELYQSTAQTLLPTYNDKGLEIGLDAVDNECLEIVPGGNRPTNPLSYLAGTDPGVFIRATLEIADSSVNDQMVIGFRKQESYQVPTSFLTTGDPLYTDVVGIGFSGTAADNLIKTITDIGNAGSCVVTSTGMGWIDAGIHQLEVRIKGRSVSYFINGKRCGERITLDATGAALAAAVTTVSQPAYTVTSGLRLIPFIFNRRGATAANANYLRRLEIGQLLEVGLQPENRGPQAS